MSRRRSRSQRALDGRAHVGLRHAARLRHPLGQQLHAPPCARDRRRPATSFGRPIVIGHVERRQARGDVRRHGRGGALEIERAAVALHVGDLPQPGQHARDRQIRSELRFSAFDSHRRHRNVTPAATPRNGARRSTPRPPKPAHLAPVDQRSGRHHRRPTARSTENTTRPAGAVRSFQVCTARKPASTTTPSTASGSSMRGDRHHGDRPRERRVAARQRQHRRPPSAGSSPAST